MPVYEGMIPGLPLSTQRSIAKPAMFRIVEPALIRKFLSWALFPNMQISMRYLFRSL